MTLCMQKKMFTLKSFLAINHVNILKISSISIISFLPLFGVEWKGVAITEAYCTSRG
jgi:hypothetical protein